MTVSTQKSIVWFRQDLRLTDNPALAAASKEGKVIPVFIFDQENSREAKPGAASKVWLHHSLKALNSQLKGNLRFLKGDPRTLLPRLAHKYDANNIFWNRTYEPWQINRDKVIKTRLKEKGFLVKKLFLMFQKILLS